MEDLFSVQGLMRAHIAWAAEPNQYPVYVTRGGGAEEILANELIPLKLKERLTMTLGVMLDADENPKARYGQIRAQCVADFPSMPESIPAEGLILQNSSGKRLGVWIMPDNVSEGDLEVFLRYMVPEASRPIWQHATGSVATAKTLGASYRDCHCDKANLYTWLAWQDEPTQRPGEALTKKILDPHAPSAAPFVKWFLSLYELGAI